MAVGGVDCKWEKDAPKIGTFPYRNNQRKENALPSNNGGGANVY